VNQKERSELRRRAEAATPGPYETLRVPLDNGAISPAVLVSIAGKGRPIIDCDPLSKPSTKSRPQQAANAAYIAAANPSTVLSLLNESDRMEAENKILRRALDVAAGGSVHAVGMWADKAQAEIAAEDIAAKGGEG